MALHDDFARFRLAAEAFQLGATALRPAAERAGCSLSALHDTFARLESQFARVLVSRGDKSTPTRLTSDGQALYDALRALESFDFVPRVLGAPVETARPRLRVAVSRSLFASPLLYPDLAVELSRFRQSTELDLDVNPQLDFPRAISDIERGALDVLLAWIIPDGGRDALIKTAGVVRVEVLEPKAYVVFVASSPSVIRELEVRADPARPFNPDRLVRATVATVTRDLEPPSLREVLPDRLGGGRRLPVGSVEAVLSFVRAGVVDFGVVPAVYRELDHFRRLGHLFYSRPVAAAGVDLIMHKAAQHGKELRHVREFATSVRRVISNLHLGDHPLIPRYVNTPCWGELPAEQREIGQFPLDAEWYRKIQYGYYVDHERGPSGDAKAAHPLWRKERVEIVPLDARASARSGRKVAVDAAFEIHVRNQFDLTFGADADLFANVLTVTADCPGAHPALRKFRVVFNWCDSQAGVMYGTWRGIDPDGRPVSYANVWSENELTTNELQAVALHAMNTVGVMANAVDDAPMPAPLQSGR